MRRTSLFVFFCGLLITSSVNGPLFADELLPIACSPAKPVVRPGETVVLRVWTDPAKGGILTYYWEVSAGKIQGTGSEVTWNFAEVLQGTHTATTFVVHPTGETEKCSVQVLVEPPEAQDGITDWSPPSAAGHDAGSAARGGITGWSLLLTGAKEKPGYGLYSYILFGTRPTEETRERYLKTLEAYVSLQESIASLEASGIPVHRLNITYVPVTEMPPDRPTAQWLLDHYDFPRARAILSVLPGGYRSEGPYIISHLSPLSEIKQLGSRYLYQDLSLIMPRIISGYAREFLSQAAQEHYYWEERTARQLALKLRNILSLMARAVPEIKGAMKELKDIRDMIKWEE